MREADFKLGLSRRLKHAREDAARLLPYWRRRFEAFSNSQTGQLTLWGLFLYSILSGLLFRALNLVFTLWLFAPILLLPVMLASRNRMQTAQQARSGPGQQGATSRGAKWYQRAQQQRSQAQQRYEQQQAQRSPFGSEDGPVIDAEWRDVDR